VSGILGMWNAIVESVGVLIIVFVGLGLMLGAIEPGRAFGRIAGVLGCMVLLLELPLILAGIWHSLSFWQHLEILSVALLVGFVMVYGATPRSKGSNSRG